MVYKKKRERAAGVVSWDKVVQTKEATATAKNCPTSLFLARGPAGVTLASWPAERELCRLLPSWPHRREARQNAGNEAFGTSANASAHIFAHRAAPPGGQQPLKNPLIYSELSILRRCACVCVCVSLFSLPPGTATPGGHQWSATPKKWLIGSSSQQAQGQNMVHFCLCVCMCPSVTSVRGTLALPTRPGP